ALLLFRSAACVSLCLEEGKREVKAVLHTPMGYATGCWLVPDIHHRQGHYIDAPGTGEYGAELSTSAKADFTGAEGEGGGAGPGSSDETRSDRCPSWRRRRCRTRHRRSRTCCRTGGPAGVSCVPAWRAGSADNRGSSPRTHRSCRAARTSCEFYTEPI